MQKKLMSAFLLLGVAALIPIAIIAQTSSGLAVQDDLTAQDYIDIEQLIYKYAYALDHCSDDGDSYANLFVADGQFGTTSDWDVPPTKVVRGHDALARLGGGTGVGGVCRDPRLSRNYGATHITVDLVITPVPGGAVGKSIPLLIGADGDPTTVVSQGGKRDFFVKTPQGWRFKSEWHVELSGGAQGSTMSERRAGTGR